MTVLALTIAIGLKHAIIGKRRPGLYNWDESSYCQRWQVDMTVFATPASALFPALSFTLTGASSWCSS